ncbi:MAG: DMT family transporter [Gammaproteobacteria bacterium]|nr:DMT family transporter [Gammaproteobacteria bacterium]
MRVRLYSPLLMAILSALLFGAATPASKWLLNELSAFQLAGLLYLGAALGVAPFAFRKSAHQPVSIWPKDKKNTQRLGGAILAGGILAPVFLLFGLQLSSASSVSLLLNLELVATVILGVIFFKDTLGKMGLVGALVALLAAVLLSFNQEASGWLAAFFVLAGCAFWGLDNHLTALVDTVSPAQSTFWKGLVAGVVNWLLGAMLAGWDVSFLAVLTALFVGVWSYGASIVLYIQSAQHIGATRGQVIFSAAPFFGVLLSALVLGETLVWNHWLAAVFFMVSIALLMCEGHAHEHKHTALSHNHLHSHDDGHHLHHHPGQPASLKHTHPHAHEPLVHSHPHWPDLHHRHRH